MRICLLPPFSLAAIAVISIAGQEPLRPVTIKRGQALAFETTQTVNWKTARVGDPVPLRLKRPLIVEGIVVLPVGTSAVGRVRHIRREKCGWVHGDWDFRQLRFADGSRVGAEIELIAEGFDDNVPDVFSTDIHGHRILGPRNHDLFKALALSPILLPIVILESPGLIAMAFADRGGACGPYVPRNILPQGSTVGVAILENHRVFR